MKFWLDQMLPRWLCGRIQALTGCNAWHVGTEYPEDPDIFRAAREAGAVLITKDTDFISLVERLGTPPQVVWLRCGNRSNRELDRILVATLPQAIRLLEQGEPIVEIAGAIGPMDSERES